MFRTNKEIKIDWDGADVLGGKLYRYVETGIDLPLIEIKESDLPRLEGREFYEPYWVVAEPPVVFAIYDRDKQIIFDSYGYSPTYSLEKLVRDEGYESVEKLQQTFREKNPASGLLSEFDIWIRLGLPAKVFLPSVPVKKLVN